MTAGLIPLFVAIAEDGRLLEEKKILHQKLVEKGRAVKTRESFRATLHEIFDKPERIIIKYMEPHLIEKDGKMVPYKHAEENIASYQKAFNETFEKDAKALSRFGDDSGDATVIYFEQLTENNDYSSKISSSGLIKMKIWVPYDAMVAIGNQARETNSESDLTWQNQRRINVAYTKGEDIFPFPTPEAQPAPTLP